MARSIFLVGALLFCLVAASSVQARPPRWNELSEKYSFNNYMRDFGRHYSLRSEEYTRRQNNFHKNLRIILDHNADGTQTYKMGVNQFTDWSAEEFKAYNRHYRRSDGLQPASIHRAPVGTSAADLPKFVDYRKNNAPRVLTDIKNQGACGDCWGHSATESIESYYALLTSQLPVLSTQQITSCTLPPAAYGCGGGDMSAGWEYLMNSTGLNEEWVYPFVDFFAKAESWEATAPCKNITAEFLPNFPWYPKAGVKGYVRVAMNDELATLHALATIGPQSISVAASLWGFYEGGIYQNNGTSSQNWQIDHAVQLVGYGYDYGLAMDYWIVRNSWGTEWGENGFIRLARFPGNEPCGICNDCGNNPTQVCGTSAVLSYPDRPIVTTLSQVNP